MLAKFCQEIFFANSFGLGVFTSKWCLHNCNPIQVFVVSTQFTQLSISSSIRNKTTGSQVFNVLSYFLLTFYSLINILSTFFTFYILIFLHSIFFETSTWKVSTSSIRSIQALWNFRRHDKTFADVVIFRQLSPKNSSSILPDSNPTEGTSSPPTSVHTILLDRKCPHS